MVAGLFIGALRRSFPLHSGAKKWRASVGAAGQMRLALIVLSVRLDPLVSGTLAGICLVSRCLRFVERSFVSVPARDLLALATLGGGGGLRYANSLFR